MAHPSQQVSLDELLVRAQGYAEFAMRNIGRVPPSLLAETPTGPIHFIPSSLTDERAKNDFADTARLICVGYGATAAVMVLEAWMKVAKPGEGLDPTEPSSEAFDRREVVALTGETLEYRKQKMLPIIRTDAGGFFGFGEYDGPKLDDYQGRFAQILPPRVPDAKARETARGLLAEVGVTEQQLRGGFESN
jgi:hypothetical protein